MIIRPDIIKRANLVLKDWKSATDFTKVWILMDWSPAVNGLAYEELSVILYPDEIFHNGAPRSRALRRAKFLVRKVRQHPQNEGLLPFAVQRTITMNIPNRGTVVRSQYFVKNITDKAEWEKLRKKFDSTITGFHNTIKRVSKIMDKPLSERADNIIKMTNELGAELRLEEIPNGNNKKKRKQHT